MVPLGVFGLQQGSRYINTLFRYSPHCDFAGCRCTRRTEGSRGATPEHSNQLCGHRRGAHADSYLECVSAAARPAAATCAAGRRFIEALESTLLAVSGLCRDWVQQLADLELKARQREVIQNGGIHERGPRDGAPSYSEGDIGPTGFKSVGGEDAVQLAVGFLFRILADANLTTQAWRDTSRSGVAGQKAKPDFSSFIYLPQLWHSMVSSCTRDNLATL